MLSPLSPQSGGSDQERTKKKRRGDRYSVQTSLIVATLKKMLPIGLNMCAPTDQELIAQAKNRYALVPAPPRDGNLPAPDPTPHQAPGPLLNPQDPTGSPLQDPEYSWVPLGCPEPSPRLLRTPLRILPEPWDLRTLTGTPLKLGISLRPLGPKDRIEPSRAVLNTAPHLDPA